MLPVLRDLTWETLDPGVLGAFWAALLDRPVTEVAGATLLVDGDDTQLPLRFVRGRGRDAQPNRVHLHLASTSGEHQLETVARALRGGARHVDVGQRPEEGHVVLADPEGNEFCVIEAGNAYLEGCGFLAELACEGSRQVGQFWSAALGWPLVWDADQETAVQSPRGGTKVAWGGPPVALGPARDRQRLRLSAAGADVDAVLGRLVDLGATRLAGDEDGSVLADPDGTAFHLVG